MVLLLFYNIDMKKSFVKKTIVIFLLICIIPFSVLMVFFLNATQKFEQQRIDESLGMIISEKAETLKKDMENAEDNVHNLARWAGYMSESGVDISEFQTKYKRNHKGVLEAPGEKSSSYLPNNIKVSDAIKKEALQTEKMVPVMGDVVKENDGISCTYLVTENGFMRVFPYLENEIFDSDHDQRKDAFYTIVNAKKSHRKMVHWTKPYFDYAGHGWITTCSAPYYVKGKMKGVVCADLLLDNLTQSIVDFRIGDSGFAFLITEGGDVIYHPDMKNLAGEMGAAYETAYGANYDDPKTRQSILKEMQQKKEGQIDFTEGDKDKIIAYREIKNVDWLIGIEIDRDDYAVDKGYLTAGVWVAVGVIFVLAIIFGGAISRKITVPILQLTDGVRKMEEGQFGRISVSSQDEIGLLGEAFNKMGETLNEYTNSLVYSKNQLESIFGSISDTIMILDLNYQIAKMNQTGLEENTDPTKCTGMKCYQVLRNQSEPCKGCPVQKTLEQRQENKSDVACLSNIYQVIAYPVIDVDGHLKELVILEKDITESKLIEKELFQTEKMAGVGQMVAGVTHELKNPLSVIKGATYLLGHSDINEEQQDIIEEIDSNVARAETIVYNMLDFSKRTPNDNKEFGLRKQLEQILLLVRQDCVVRKIVTELTVSETFTIWGNGDSFKHIFLNIITNGIEAMPDGGQLRIKAKKTKRNLIEIEIKNTGEPISGENVAQIFEPFYSTKEAGTGLGLWIVSKEVERNHGTIRVINDADGVTTVVTLPENEEGSRNAENTDD